ncbi:hypothetical protein ALI144C_41775 [Actinosynnema sp. ALI-1.44]|uniref:hypothetical protein n=1 Tax=Actinosynnema sp. ALI-1.44 TaxID=1933779 RepID=UPI00097C14C5|nr:hypothetical protein [Actinosynnema sp. ALI-1.44]ONI75393.1 hypothetical protein ALI144C_41775 [Actinosynnema sp. ALI-1.44]
MARMYYQLPEPEPVRHVRHDRPAVAIGNASLLGVGYLMLGRRAWAVATALVTIGLVVLLGTVVPGVWFEVLFLVWWAALIAHGWYLAGKPSRAAAVRRPRLLALLMAVPVVAAVGYVRFDAARVEDSIVEARDGGDCGKARSALDRIWLGHTIVDGPMTVRSERTAQACDRLAKTKETLEIAASRRDPDGLRSSYHELAAVLTDLPGHDKMVGTVLDGFLGSLSGRAPCDLAELTDWLRKRPASRNLLDRSADVVPKIAPAALAGCAEKMAAAADWNGAKGRYQQLLDQYPGHALAAKAQEGVTQATRQLELSRLATLGSNYCTTPATYSGAAPYAKGTTNRAVVHHPDKSATPQIEKLPAEWKADNTQAVMVVCIGAKEFGAAVRTCRYRSLSDSRIQNVTFNKMAFTVKAYELRTGNVVIDTRVEVGGATCPQLITGFEGSVLSDKYVEPSDADIRTAFAPIFTS